MTPALAQVYRRFGAADAARTSPLYERVAVALSESGPALRAIGAAPARKRHPAVILAALHDLALSGRAPALAAAYAAADGEAAGAAAIDTLRHRTDLVVAIAGRWPLRPDETGRAAVLYPAVAEAARRAGATAIGHPTGPALRAHVVRCAVGSWLQELPGAPRRLPPSVTRCRQPRRGGRLLAQAGPPVGDVSSDGSGDAARPVDLADRGREFTRGPCDERDGRSGIGEPGAQQPAEASAAAAHQRDHAF